MSKSAVSIPLQGLQPFGPEYWDWEAKEWKKGFNPSSRITTFRTRLRRKGKFEVYMKVSIPLQGLQPFGRESLRGQRATKDAFQSLFKDYNLSDTYTATSTRPLMVVSIPLQGLQPFGRNPWLRRPYKGMQWFQSLFKDYNLSDLGIRVAQ